LAPGSVGSPAGFADREQIVVLVENRERERSVGLIPSGTPPSQLLAGAKDGVGRCGLRIHLHVARIDPGGPFRRC
jgi:hypothetical protein